MAEAVILPLANSILKNIAAFSGDYVAEEFEGFKSVKEDLKSISDDLECITAVLRDAEAKQYTNAAMKIWLRDLKSVVYDIDDLLDEAATDALQRRLDKGHFLTRLRYYLPLISRFDLSHKLKDLRVQLEHIVAKRSKFGLTERPVEAPSVERDVFYVCGYVNKLAIVGRDEAKNNIINRVLGVGGEDGLSVLPIIGMGGIGKTAFAKLVYNDINHFDMKLWVCVSDKFDLQKTLQDILKEVTHENTSNYSLGQLIRELQEVLEDKKFLLLLDDLWEDDNRLWVQLKSILVVGGRGSCILITTRMENVASITKTVEPYHLKKLSEADCWSIFKTFAFGDGEEERYPRLCEIGKSIVEKCCGIPLVVQSLGSLLRSNKDVGEWQRIKNLKNLTQLDGQHDKTKRVLKLSYDKLPSHLKNCFAHLSLLPKDFVYGPHQHLHYWSALGLLQPRDESCFKPNFFQELLSRSMIQDVALNFMNIILTCKIHDFNHDLAEDILGEELVVVTDKMCSVPDASRYIGWSSKYLLEGEYPEEMKAKKIRAFIFQNAMGYVSQSFLKGIISNMPCLRILDLRTGKFDELPCSIGNLKHLRMLDLSYNALIKSLPDSLCELLNLELLNLGGCEQLEELPSKIYKLINLQFLSLTTNQRSLLGTKFNQLPSLRHLFFRKCKRLVSLWDDDDIGCLTSLRTLYFNGCPRLSSLPNSMKLLAGLEYLFIDNCNNSDLEGGQGLSGLASLESLVINQLPRLSGFPKGIHSAASSLKYLVISKCDGLTVVPDGFHSFVCLDRVYITSCPNLTSLPKGIRQLNSLQFLYIDGCSHITERCAIPDGEDLSLIRHVPEIWLDRRLLVLNQQ